MKVRSVLTKSMVMTRRTLMVAAQLRWEAAWPLCRLGFLKCELCVRLCSSKDQHIVGSGSPSCVAVANRFLSRVFSSQTAACSLRRLCVAWAISWTVTSTRLTFIACLAAFVQVSVLCRSSFLCFQAALPLSVSWRSFFFKRAFPLFKRPCR